MTLNTIQTPHRVARADVTYLCVVKLSYVHTQERLVIRNSSRTVDILSQMIG